MDMSAYAHLAELMFAGVKQGFGLQALFAFVAFALFMVTVQGRSSDEKQAASDTRWAGFSALSAFVATSTVLYILDTPLSGGFLSQGFALGLDYSYLASVMVVVLFALCALWLSMPVEEKAVKVSVVEEDDLSAAPFLGLALGVALSGFVFLGGEWHALLLAQAKGVEYMHQASFYGVMFSLSLALLWAVFVAGLSVSTSKLGVRLPSTVAVLFLVLMAVAHVALRFVG